MIQRAYIWVAGPPGAGKTTLGERLLRAHETRIVVAARFRAEAEPAQSQVDERGDEDTRRMLAAGACSTLLVRYPKGEEGHGADAFWSRLEDYSEAILFEGAVPAVESDLVIYVMRPLLRRGSLLRKTTISTRRAIDAAVELFAGTVIYEQVRKGMHAEAARRRAAGTPFPPEVRWSLRAPHEQLAKAELVVIAIRGEHERAAAERTATEIARLREDEHIWRCIREPTVSPRRASVFIANLSDPRDAAFKKVAARVGTVIRRIADEPRSSDW